MALILTFLGKSGSDRTKIAIAAAQQLATGKRVLLAERDTSPALGLLIDTPITSNPQPVNPTLDVVQLKTSTLLEQSWEQVKKLEAQYLRTPIIKDVYGQELPVLPGMDSALELNAIREYDASGKYDIILYNGGGDATTLRTLGMAESLSWYVRRFRQLFTNSDLGKTFSESPFIQPLISSFFNFNWTADNFSQPVNQVNNFLEQGKAALADPTRVAAFLVITSNDPIEVATTKYLWGSAQLIGLSVGGVLTNAAQITPAISPEFAPLPVTAVSSDASDVQINSLADLPQQAQQAPKPIEINVAASQIRLFLPGFDKKQVKLTQSGAEVTVEAGDQRRNIILPPGLSGKSITGAKFQNNYLTISL